MVYLFYHFFENVPKTLYGVIKTYPIFVPCHVGVPELVVGHGTPDTNRHYFVVFNKIK